MRAIATPIILERLIQLIFATLIKNVITGIARIGGNILESLHTVLEDQEGHHESQKQRMRETELEEAVNGPLTIIDLPHILKRKDEKFFWSTPAEWEINKYSEHEMISGELIFSNMRVIFHHDNHFCQIPFEKICKLIDTRREEAVHFLLEGDDNEYFLTESSTARVRFERIFAAYPPEVVLEKVSTRFSVFAAL